MTSGGVGTWWWCEVTVLMSPVRIHRSFPNEWEVVDPDAGWTRPASPLRGRRPDPTLALVERVVVVLVGAIAVVGMFACL